MPELCLHHVLGIPVHVPVLSERKAEPFSPYIAWLRDRIRDGVGTHTITVNAEMIMLGRRDPQFAAALQGADLLTPDGAGVVLALKLQRTSILRCPGIELAERLVSVAEQEGWTVYLLGGKAEVFDTVLAQWNERYPSLNVEGRNGYFDADTEAEIAKRLSVLQPQLVFVGLGAPRQEYWIRQHRHVVPAATWIGIGGSLDIWAGTKERAPQWMRDRHLEWLYRLYKEPWRWRRMLALPQFAWYVLVNGVVGK